jgi:hypothetical protein
VEFNVSRSNYVGVQRSSFAHGVHQSLKIVSWPEAIAMLLDLQVPTILSYTN